MKSFGRYSLVHVEVENLVPGNKVLMSTKGNVYTVKSTIKGNKYWTVELSRDIDGHTLDFEWRGTRVVEVFRHTL
jgi:hypothetical protein